MHVSEVSAARRAHMLVATQQEMELLAAVMRETVRLSDDRESTHAQPMRDFSQRLLDAVQPWSSLRISDQHPSDFLVVAKEVTYSCMLSDLAIQLLSESILYLLAEVTRPQLHTLTGLLPDQLWQAHFQLTGRYPEKLIR